MIAARGGTSVMAQRKEPPASLDFFPTPPWATRAGVEIIRAIDPEARDVCDPACGEGHMAAKVRLSRLDDVRRFAAASHAALLDGVA